MKKIKLVFIISLFYQPFLFSQTKEVDNYINYISLYGNINLQNSFKERTKGKDYINYKTSTGGEFGLEFHQRITSLIELGIGMKVGIIPVYRSFFILKNDSLIDFVEDGTFDGYNKEISDWYLVPAISIKYNIVEHNNTVFYSEVGLGGNIVMPWDYYKDRIFLANEDRIIQIFEYNVYGNGKWVNLSYYLKLGIQKKMKRKIIKLGLIYNFMPDYIRKGMYQFMNIENPSTGEIELKMKYIGVELSYGIGIKKLITKSKLH